MKKHRQVGKKSDRAEAVKKGRDEIVLLDMYRPENYGL